MYLIRGESYLNTENISLAAEDLNTLRKRSGLNEVTSLDQSELLQLFLVERSLELSMEGDNFHNLKRLQMPIGGYSWEEAEYKLVFYLPEKEVQINENLVQNDIW